MTTTVTSSEECYRVASAIQEKYGKDRIIIQTYPDAIAEVETTINNAMMLAADPDCKAILFCQAMTGTIAAIERIRAERPDILLIAAGPQEEVAAAGQAADVCYAVMKKRINFVSEDRKNVGLILESSIERNIVTPALRVHKKYLKHYGFFTQLDKQAMREHEEELGKTNSKTDSQGNCEYPGGVKI